MQESLRAKKKRKKNKEDSSRPTDILEQTPRSKHFSFANLAVGHCLSPFVFSSAKKEEPVEEEAQP